MPRMLGLAAHFQGGFAGASMRPRRVCLGCPLAGIPLHMVINRFNEAEARVPRMQSCLPVGRVPLTRGFNEAEARVPRMRCRARAGVGTAVNSFNEAEARVPRMRRRINGPSEASRGFNEAEARVPRMPLPPPHMIASPFRASMRPRRVCLGCDGVIGPLTRQALMLQ